MKRKIDSRFLNSHHSKYIRISTYLLTSDVLPPTLCHDVLKRRRTPHLNFTELLNKYFATLSVLFLQNKNLFNKQIDIVFYDVTAIYFESQLSDELREFGFSKDGKFNEVQVVLGLLIDQEGRSIGYELYPSNNFDSKTLLKIHSSITNGNKRIRS